MTPDGRTPSAAGPALRDRLGGLYAAIWLPFLIEPFGSALALPEPKRWLAVAALSGFVLAYLAAFWGSTQMRRRRGHDPSTAWGLAALAVLGLLAALTLWVLGQDGASVLVFAAAAAAQVVRPPIGAVVTALLALLNEVAGRTWPGWAYNGWVSFAIAVAFISVWAVRQGVARNRALVAAEQRLAQLAVVEERNRIAGELHDVLGHSLTVITVKAELAGRLLELDPERAAAEVADVERLAREALADVRAVTTGYRSVTLPGELSRAQQALTAAGVAVRITGRADDVPEARRELFARVVSEGVINVIRHSGAGRCDISLTARSVEVADDGRFAASAAGDSAHLGSSGTEGTGTGLAELRRRAEEAGAALIVRRDSSSFRLRVEFADD